VATELFSWRADPAVPPFADEHPLIVFDGECVLCSVNARFVLARDRRRRFRLTTAQGPLGQALYRDFGLSRPDYGTMLVITEGRLLIEAAAALAIAEGLGFPWRAAALARLLPGRLNDAAYRLVARNRFRLFGRRETCWVPRPEDRDRIL
jgi:predicted DCC family thiol-disulfide oxidoreductase YuxK